MPGSSCSGAVLHHHGVTTTNPGHLFLVHADLRHLSVDAWLLPTDLHGSVTHVWSDGEPPLARRIRVWTDSVRSNGAPVERVQLLPGRVEDEPFVVLCAIPVEGIADPVYHLDSVRQAVPLVEENRGGGMPRLRLALPALGIGASGGARVRGEVLAGLVRGLRDVAADLGVDLVLTLSTAEAIAAARHVRRSEGPGRWWPDLDVEEMHNVRRLAGLAAAGRLALFIGAGTSMAAGLPSWRCLLEGLEKYVEGTDAGRVPGLEALSLLDRASIVADELGGRLGSAIAEQLPSRGYSLQHALLANLPVRHAVTTNYDRLLEAAATDAHDRFAVLPYEAAEGRRWLLKLHGDLDEEGVGTDLVLTRAHYLAAPNHRATLTGLVQAVLATEHFLFVGFSLEDPHVQELVHDVRTAMGPGHEQFGTALMLHAQPAHKRLWQHDVGIVALDDPERERTGRHLEIFLDALADAADPAYLHLGDPTWSGTLNQEEMVLAEQLRDLHKVVSDHPGAAWQRLRDALSAYGYQ